MKMKMVKPTVWFIIVMLAAAFVGCGSTTVRTDFDPSKLAEQEVYSDAPGTLDVTYDSLSKIVNDASCIALVDVTGRRIEMPDGYPQTHTTVKLAEVLKGSEKAGDTLEVIEEGGGSEEFLFGNYPQLSRDKQYILFLKYSDGNYYICGAFQGRFVINDGYVVQQTVEGVGVKDYTPVKVEEFKTLIAQ